MAKEVRLVNKTGSVLRTCSALVVLSAVLVLVVFMRSRDSRMGTRADVERVVSERPECAILLCSVETRDDVRVLKVARCIRPFENNDQHDWNQVRLLPLGEGTERCQGAVVYVDPKEMAAVLIAYIYDGKVSLLAPGDNKEVTVADYIAGAARVAAKGEQTSEQ